MNTQKVKDQKSKEHEIISQLEQQVQELEGNWKRALADYKNLEKRSQEEESLNIEFANVVLLEQLVPVIDNFDMVEKHTQDLGLKYTIKDFKQVLENVGLKILNVNVGDEFDPKTMHVVDTGNGDKNKIIEVLSKGYIFKSKLIRPVNVKVGNGQDAQTPEKKEDNTNK